MLLQDSFKNPWKSDGVKAYALCPWFAPTELVKESVGIAELEKKIKTRVLTIEEVKAKDPRICAAVIFNLLSSNRSAVP